MAFTEEGMVGWMNGRMVLAAMVVGLVLGGGCKKSKPPETDYWAQLGPGEKALRKIPLAEYPDFSQCEWNLSLVPQSIDHSLYYMSAPSSRQFYPYLDITHERALASLRAFRQVVGEAQKRPGPGAYINEQIRANFEVYRSVGAPDPGGKGYSNQVLFTGYCTPDRDASPVKTGQFQWPIYKRPRDLVADAATGQILGRKTPDGKTVPYWTREEIERDNKLAGQEFYYLKSRWEAYVVTVQGSARLRMPDGKIVKIGYAGNNGYDYTSPGKLLVADGVMKPQDLNLRALAKYFTENPQAADKYLWANKRTVFFTEETGETRGSLNVPVTSFGTIATDKDVYPRAMSAFLVVDVPRTDNVTQKWPFRGFMMDQDTGGAIRAAGRCDIYMGVGDKAEDMAGHQLSAGQLYYIAIKPELIPNYATPMPAERTPKAKAK